MEKAEATSASPEITRENLSNQSEAVPRPLFHWLSWALGIAILIIFASCGSDGGGTMGPDPDPDPDPDPEPTGLVSYSQDIQPIFNGSCAVSGCHDSGTVQNGVNLSSYDNAITSVGSQYGMEVIEPGAPDDSPIVDKISNDNPEHGQRMPLNRSALSSAQIDSIRAWIEDDAPDN